MNPIHLIREIYHEAEEIRRLLGKILKGNELEERARKFHEFQKLMIEDFEYAKHAHDVFLPAARRWEQYRRNHPGPLDARGMSLRGKLGNACVGLYSKQYKTYSRSIRMWIKNDDNPVYSPLLQHMIDSTWHVFRELESRAMAWDRRRSASRRR